MMHIKIIQKTVLKHISIGPTSYPDKTRRAGCLSYKPEKNMITYTNKERKRGSIQMGNLLQ